mmetsp:Transcript_8727/g.24972  ORF Transcript_8727/g.24972 Transcript_8727/m.24972 type:complete len:233 (-) Transcript_8727:456-1154(-)
MRFFSPSDSTSASAPLSSAPPMEATPSPPLAAPSGMCASSSSGMRWNRIGVPLADAEASTPKLWPPRCAHGVGPERLSRTIRRLLRPLVSTSPSALAACASSCGCPVVSTVASLPSRMALWSSKLSSSSSSSSKSTSTSIADLPSPFSNSFPEPGPGTSSSRFRRFGPRLRSDRAPILPSRSCAPPRPLPPRKGTSVMPPAEVFSRRSRLRPREDSADAAWEKERRWSALRR